AFDVAVTRAKNEDDVEALATLARERGEVAVAAAWEGAEGRSALAGVALATADDQATWVDASLLSALAPLVADESVVVHAHRAKELLRGLDRVGLDLRAVGIDL